MAKIYRRRSTNGEVTLKELMAREPSPTDGKPVVYDAADDTYKTTDEINIEKASFDTLTASKAYIQELHAVQERQEVSTSDYLMLRANNNSQITSGNYSGVIVNNYNGENVLGIVSDSNGVARVGTGDKTNTTYADLYYSGGKYYTDETLEVEVTPEGEMTAWDSIEETDDYTHYTNAVFSVIDLSDTQALLTRKEDVDMNDKGILIYDKTSHRSETIALPVRDEQTLEAHVVEEAGETTISYRWKDKQAGSYVYATMADYEADAANVPVGSQIIIEDEKNYLTGDDQ